MTGQTLLIIVHDQNLAEILRTALSARGYTVWIATTGEKGIQQARSEQPALIVIDDQLPDMPVQEVVEALRVDSATSSIPFILLSAPGKSEKIAGLIDDGDNIISKPVDVEEAHLEIKNVLARRRSLLEREEAEAAEVEIIDDFLKLDDESPKEEFFGGGIAPALPAAEAAPAAPPFIPPPAPIAPLPRPITPPAIQPQAPDRQSPLTESSSPVPDAKPGAPEGKSSSSASKPQTIQFGAYHPREIVPNEWKPLIAYVYYSSAAAEVEADAGKQLGPLLAGFRKLTQAAKGLINEGATITATPTLPGFQFNPPSVSVAFYEDWHRFDFKLRAKDAPLHQAANGLITFTVEGLIVGDVPLSVFVTDSEQTMPTVQASSKIYDTIFCSYSRKDVQIVQRVERAYKALGMDYLRDMTTLRAGEEWNDELKELITRANIFQLFWSPASSQSDHVRMEWEYALTMKAEREGFIRPVYWTQPIPAVPPSLSHLHFAYQPDLVD